MGIRPIMIAVAFLLYAASASAGGFKCSDGTCGSITGLQYNSTKCEMPEKPAIKAVNSAAYGTSVKLVQDYLAKEKEYSNCIIAEANADVAELQQAMNDYLQAAQRASGRRSADISTEMSKAFDKLSAAHGDLTSKESRIKGFKPGPCDPNASIQECANSH